MRLIPACAGKTPWRTRSPPSSRAHPRVCGENIPRPPRSIRSRGSSPRVRGKPSETTRTVRIAGLIPACAGKTSRASKSGTHLRAHPRVCGENTIPRPGTVAYVGSSPRVRGKHGAVQREHRGRRLIPACAGKTRCPAPSAASSAAHPRVCGENDGTPVATSAADGSSPRVRGKRRPPRLDQHRRRLIPACAGKTARRARSRRARTAHPRVCGENGAEGAEPGGDAGSSPRVRGKPPATCWYVLASGLIPACAGKTSRACSSPEARAAHPRVCGENVVSPGSARDAIGSSPRVRGKPERQHPVSEDARLIPACAGKTPRSPTRFPLPSAHPRVCGENSGYLR